MAVTGTAHAWPKTAAPPGEKREDSGATKSRVPKRLLLILGILATIVVTALLAYRLIPSSPAPAQSPPPKLSRSVPTPTTAPNIQLPTSGATRDPFAPSS